MNSIQKNWINFKTHFCTAHRELEETGELTMEDAVYHQANLVNNIFVHMSGLSFPYPPQGCHDPVYTLISNYAPTISPIVQPYPAANDATNATYNILPQLLNRM